VAFARRELLSGEARVLSTRNGTSPSVDPKPHDTNSMRLSRFALPLALSFVTLTRPAFAQDTSATHKEAVKQLMTVTHVRELTQQSMDAVMASQMEQMPQLKPYESIMKTFLKEQMDWSILEPEFTRIYAEVFTEKELRDMTAIYQTPVGQMMLAKMPGLLAKSNEFTQRRLKEGLPILAQRLEAAMKEKSAAPAPAEH